MPRLPRITSLPVLTGAFVVVTLLAAGPLRDLDALLQAYWARRYTPNWHHFLVDVPNAVAGQAVCVPILAAAYLLRSYAHPDLRVRTRTFWIVLLIAANALLIAFYLGFHWPTDLIGGVLAGGMLLRLLVDVDRRRTRLRQAGLNVFRSSASTIR